MVLEYGTSVRVVAVPLVRCLAVHESGWSWPAFLLLPAGGSFALYAAARYPGSRITAVSNSRTQREFIMELAKERRLTNLQVPAAAAAAARLVGGWGWGWGCLRWGC